MQITLTLPRDIKPGDKVRRYHPTTLDEVIATVKEVLQVRRSGAMAYKVYLEEYDALSSYEKSVGNGHLVPFIVAPRNKVEVVVGQEA